MNQFDQIDFRTFADFRRSVLASGDVLDLADTAMARALVPYLPPIRQEELPERAHRCHLAEDWLALFGLPAEWRREALVGVGVRDSLARLLRWMSARAMTVAIPSDVYPEYGRIANGAGVRHVGYDGYPSLDVEMIEPCDAILVCNPMKPRGCALREREIEGLIGWLAQDGSRRVIVDAVYTFGTRFDDATIRLLATGQAWLLHSLSKGWARPLVMGVALGPKDDMDAEIVGAFRNAEVDGQRLRLAQFLMREHAEFPGTLPGLFALAEARLRDELAARSVRILSVPEPAARYLFLVDADWRELRDRERVLLMPFSVFGREIKGISVASSISLLP